GGCRVALGIDAARWRVHGYRVGADVWKSDELRAAGTAGGPAPNVAILSAASGKADASSHLDARIDRRNRNHLAVGVHRNRGTGRVALGKDPPGGRQDCDVKGADRRKAHG